MATTSPQKPLSLEERNNLIVNAIYEGKTPEDTAAATAIASGAPVSIQTMTPTVAAILVKDHNVHNRPISEVTVGAYADMMKRGEWTLTNQGIAFNGDGTLIDGQHRLKACAISGIAIPLEVSCGLDKEIITRIDGGRARQAHEALTMAGVGDAKIKETIARLVEDYIARTGDSSAVHLSSRILIEKYVKENDESLTASLVMAKQACSNIAEPTMGESMAASTIYLMHRGGWPDHMIAAYMASVQQGIGAFDNDVIVPVAQMLAKARRNDNAKDKMSKADQLATLMQGSRHWVNGDRVARFKAVHVVANKPAPTHRPDDAALKAAKPQ